MALRLLLALVAADVAWGLPPLSWEEAEARADATLAELTVEERHSLMTGIGWRADSGYMGMGTMLSGYYMGNTPPIPRLGVPALKLHDAGNGFRNNWAPFWSEAKHGFGSSTCWPSALALASSWDDGLVRRVAGAIAREFRAKGANAVLGPGAQVHRVARNGRNFEYLSGDDAYLGARLTAAYVEGVQDEGLLACAKHWAFNEQETERFGGSSNVDERTAWELYYPPFEAAVEAGVASVMCGYNRVNGTFSCESESLLRRDLKERMGFRGFVVSDWWATRSTAVEHGLDLEMPGTGVGAWPLQHGPFYTHEELTHAEAPGERPLLSRWWHWARWSLLHFWIGPHGFFEGSGNVAAPRPTSRAAAFAEPARRVLAAMYRWRLDEAPGCAPGSEECMQQLLVNTRAEHVELNREAAVRSVVLVKNEQGVLPLRPIIVGKVAVMGNALVSESRHWSAHMPPADHYSGGGSGHVGADAASLEPPLAALRRRAAAAGIEVLASNCSGAGACGNRSGDVDVAEALRVARLADVAVFVAAVTATEGEDRPDLRLGAVDEAIAAVAAERPTVVLLQIPGALVMPWRDQAAAIACTFLGGEQTGHAWASILFGDAAPSGKLPIMLPKTEQDTIAPVEGWQVPYSEGVFTSYRAADAAERAAFPFGHGLSYAAFDFGAPREVALSACGAAARSLLRPRALAACVAVEVTNIGAAPGVEVAQAYVEFPPALGQPRLLLRGVHRTAELPPGGAEVALFALTRRDLSVYRAGRWRPADGVTLHVGASSGDLRGAVELGDEPMAPRSASEEL